MADQHGDTNLNSDQEDLIELTSSSDLDDEDGGLSDDYGIEQHNYNSKNDTINFDISKANANSLLVVDPTNYDWNSDDQKEYQSKRERQRLQLLNCRECKRIFLLLITFGSGLLLASFSLLIVLPLYQKQLEVARKSNNSYGSIVFLAPIITILLIILSYLLSCIYKWTERIHKLPMMPMKRLLLISCCCGVASALCTVSAYKRVPCHLQDPLKGAALVYSLIFYFFFSKKVMGLQKIFSATTSVVGLFISVDYGLCDEFRCHGCDTSTISQQDTGEIKQKHSIGWQGHAFWTLLYLFGIMLWTLHLTLLEANLIMFSVNSNKQPPFSLLKTISRLVSHSDNSPVEFNQPPPKTSNPQRKQRLQPLHIASWIHLISLLVLLMLGLIDIIPSSGTMKSFSQHWKDTGNTFMCHLGIRPNNENNYPKPLEHDDDTFKYLTNSTQDIIVYNQTVQNLHHRNKRNLENRHLKYFHRRIGHHLYESAHLLAAIHSGQNHTLFNVSRRKYKKLTSTQIPLVSRLVLTDDLKDRIDCNTLATYSWILIGNYLIFTICLFYFLFNSESAVFTISIITSALPFIGLFWSFFKLENTTRTAFLRWSPSISGELICSLLGAPIVFLGLILLYRAHFVDMLRPSSRKSLFMTTHSYQNLENA